MEVEQEEKAHQSNKEAGKDQNKENMEMEEKVNQENIEALTEKAKEKTEKEEIKMNNFQENNESNKEIEKKELINKDEIEPDLQKEKIILKEKEIINNEKKEITNLFKLTEKKEEEKEKLEEIDQKIEKLKEEEIKNIKLIPKQEYTIVVIHDITPNVTEEHLKEIFSFYGEIKDAFIPINKETLLKKKYAFIEFVKKEEAERAQLYMDGGQIDGRVVKVEIIDKKNQIELK